jgi:uncharacterized membrane protein (DUF106 family)
LTDDAQPLPSADAEEPADGSAPLADDTAQPAPAPARPRPPPPEFKFSTFLYVFLGLLGLWMLIDVQARNAFGAGLGISPTSSGPLYLAIGFQSNYLLLTMALAGALEMLFTAIAYNFTTDWVKSARIQKWSAAFRKVQMEAIRSGKKDRIAALKPHQERLTRLTSEVSIAQFKGMAITYFLLILIYTWVGLVISHATQAQQTLNLGGASIDLMGRVIASLPIPWWFLIFSVYTIPFSMAFRRVLKNLWLERYLRQHPPSGTGAAGSSA